MSGAQLMRVNQGDRHRGIDGKYRRNVEPRSWLLCRTDVHGSVPWAIPQSKARIAGATKQVDTFKMMTTGKQLPSEHFADYSFVFN